MFKATKKELKKARKLVLEWWLGQTHYKLYVPEWDATHYAFGVREYWSWRLQYPTECAVDCTCPKNRWFAMIS